MADNAPTIPVTERTTVPVSALFSDDERKMPENPVAAASPNDTVLPVEKPAAPAATPAPAKPTDPPVSDPATPAPAKPTDPPVSDPATPAPAKPAVPETKVKIGDKEYTTKELEQALAAKAAPAPAPAPAVAPAAPAAKPPTPEEIATAETSWVDKFISEEKLAVAFTEKEMESILTGDKDGITTLSHKFTFAVAKAVLLARKSIYNELNPVISRLEGSLKPVLQNAQEVEAVAAEQQFFTAYPDFKAHADTVRRVGMALLERFPNECRAMSREALLAEVAAQSDRIIQDECNRFAPGKNWRQLQAATPAAIVPASAPVAAAPAAPAPAPAPAVKPPASNSPAAVGTGTTPPKDWHKATASSLAN